VEYEMPGLSQSQVQPDIGYDFAAGLRSALRQDPDIIMVGEIRDQETIEIAIKAALTGHMVLSTIHTNSAVATITRILDMGVKPYKITSSLRTIEAQRLVRRICQNCKEAVPAEPLVVEEIRKTLLKLHPDEEFDRGLLENMQIYKGKGCDICEGTGMKGRVALYEVMTMSREIEKLVLDGSREIDIEEVAIQQGMTTLIQDGFMKVLLGVTSLEEVYKVVAAD
jgi:type II secretory ATPase GspE/PulE/Tfp pilus assembly ATPase PilB-like protein